MRNEHSPKGGPRLDPYKPNPRTIKPIEIRPSVEVQSRLEIEADKRGITLTELCSTLLSVAAQDGIVGAVLDD